MRIVGLPGRNPETEAWLEVLLASVAPDHAEVQVHRYRHWDEDAVPDLAGEIACAEVKGADLVVAKSMGTLVLLGAVASGKAPDCAVLIGTPLAACGSEERRALRGLADLIPCCFIQQREDFTGSSAELAEVLGPAATGLNVVEGSDHVYADTDELARCIAAWQAEL
ncbi:MAG: hypothetical protein AAGE43_01630 [Pseudomonadota bacterium]